MPFPTPGPPRTKTTVTSRGSNAGLVRGVERCCFMSGIAVAMDVGGVMLVFVFLTLSVIYWGGGRGWWHRQLVAASEKSKTKQTAQKINKKMYI